MNENPKDEHLKDNKNPQGVLQALQIAAMENRKTKNRYLEVLEKCNLKEVPQRTHLYTTAALDHYVIQIRTQAEQSFLDARRICWAGFTLIASGIVIAFAGSLRDLENSLDIGKVAVAGGTIVEILSGTVFIIHGRAIDQSNSIIENISKSQKYAFDAMQSDLLSSDKSDEHNYQSEKRKVKRLDESRKLEQKL